MAFYGNNNSYSYDAERIHEDSYSSRYNGGYGAAGCVNTDYPMGHNRHNAVIADTCETDIIVPRHGHHHGHHGGAVEYVHRDQNIAYESDNSYADPCMRRPYC